MEVETTKSIKWRWLAGILAFLFFTWLFANWEDFKEGFLDGSAEHAKSKP